MTKTNIYNETTFNRLIENAVKFNNFEVLVYLLSLGIDYTSLYTFSLVYDQFVLRNLALKLPYNRNFSFVYVKNVLLDPYSFKYHKEILFIVFIWIHYLLQFIIINSKLLQVDLSFKKRYNNQSPLAFADKNGKNDIFAYLIKKDDFNSDQIIDGLTFFEDAFLNDEMKYQMNYIMKMPELKIIGKFTMTHFS